MVDKINNISNKHLLASIPSVSLFPSISEGLQNGGDPQPFMVKNAFAEFLGVHTPEIVLSTLKSSKCYMHGYNKLGQLIKTSSDAIHDEWQRGYQPLNILDVSLEVLSTFLPLKTHETLQAPSIAPVLTKLGRYTALHIDPPWKGGGWMFLTTGEKQWLFVDPKYIELLINPETYVFSDLSLENLLEIIPSTHIRQCLLTDGDFLFFPPAWVHRVYTSRDAVGLGAFFPPREEEQILIEKYSKFYPEDEDRLYYPEVM